MRECEPELSFRMREIRVAEFGEDGVANLSEALKIPARTWMHFEGGVAIPGWVVLQFLELTGVEPHWLLTGEGERYRVGRDQAARRAIS